MDRERFDYLCDKSKEGHEDVFVQHSSGMEGGEVLHCEFDTLVVRTSQGEERRWNYRECEETLSRRGIFPYR